MNPFAPILSVFRAIGLAPPPEIERVTMPVMLGELAMRVALSELGHGETVGNNRGPDIERYRGGDGTGGSPGGSGAWCASFVSWCFVQLAHQAGLTLPFDTSRGAKRLAKNIAAAGDRIDPAKAQGGDVICWHRGKAGSWQGHVGFVEMRDRSGLLHTVEGNVGAFPSRVRRLVHDPDHERVYLVARI